MTRRIVLAIDLLPEPAVIADYDRLHSTGVLPVTVAHGLKRGGVVEMQIYRIANRLWMIAEVEDHFSWEAMRQLDQGDSEITAWAEAMQRIQVPIPGTNCEGWAEPVEVFRLSDHGTTETK